MKRFSLLTGIAFAMALTACGSGASNEGSIPGPVDTSVRGSVSKVVSNSTLVLTPFLGMTNQITNPTYYNALNATYIQSSAPVNNMPSYVNTSATILEYVAITPSAPTTASGSLTLSTTLPGPASGSTAYHLAFFDGASWQPYSANGVVSASTITFASIPLPSGGLALSAGTTYGVALYY